MKNDDVIASNETFNVVRMELGLALGLIKARSMSLLLKMEKDGIGLIN